MKKLDLTGWAALAEIVGAIAVVISLIFVAHSVNRNTAQLQANNDNLLIQLQDAEMRDLALDPSLLSIILKFERGDSLNEIELSRAQLTANRMMNRWEVAFVRYEQGFLDLISWQTWDSAFSTGFAERYPESWWAEWRHAYTPSFVKHVDAVLEAAKTP